MTAKSRDAKFNIWFLAGLGVTLASALVFIILGGKSIFINHDQMDGEMLCYILNAKYLFKGNEVLEFMNGMPKTSLKPPAPLFVLLFKILPPLPAFILMRYVVVAVGYLGMYLLCIEEEIDAPFAVIAAVVFAYAPFLHVYGFSMFGIPLLIWAFKQVEKGKSIVSSLLIIVILTLGSSLVLSGFAVAIFVVFHLIGLLLIKDWNRALKAFLAAATCGITYILCNLDFFGQILGIGQTYETHKNEASIAAVSFKETFFEAIRTGLGHSSFQRLWISFFAIAIVILCGSNAKLYSNRVGKAIKLIVILLVMAVFEAFYETEAIVNLRNSIGGPAKWFQMSRIDWLAPAIVILLGAQLIQISKEMQLKWFRFVALPVSIIILVATGVSMILQDTWKANIKVLIGQESELLSWNEYYAPDVFSQADEFISTTQGLEKNQYKIVSLGINPAAALYNGFYCLDGYSNNYDVNYKHEFRQIIAPELEKNDYCKAYFDEWGNRCYLTSAQIPGYYTVQKGGFYYDDYDINTAKLKEMGAKFLFSAAYINGAENSGLTLLNDVPLDTDDSYYNLYIYKVN